SRRFDDGAVQIDNTVFNAARISKLYGTLARKSDNIPTRPHRLSKGLEYPQVFNPVPRSPLEKIAGMCATVSVPEAVHAEKPAQTSSEDGWLASFIERHQIEGRHTKPGGKFKVRYILAQCPFCKSEDNGAVLVEMHDGKFGFRCQHNRCTKPPRKRW